MRKGTVVPRIGGGSRRQGNSAKLAFLEEQRLVVQVIRHGNDKEEDH